MLATADERYFSYAEAARILGVERSTLYSRSRRAGYGTPVFPDGSRRITRSEILRYVGGAEPARMAAE